MARTKKKPTKLDVQSQNSNDVLVGVFNHVQGDTHQQHQPVESETGSAIQCSSYDSIDLQSSEECENDTELRCRKNAATHKRRRLIKACRNQNDIGKSASIATRSCASRNTQTSSISQNGSTSSPDKSVHCHRKATQDGCDILEEKKEEASDRMPFAEAKKPNPEIEIIKCNRKKCKTVLRFVSPNVYSCTSEPENDAMKSPAHLEMDDRDTTVIRTFVLYETSIESDNNTISPNIILPSAPSPMFQIQSTTAAFQILNYYSSKENRRQKKILKNTSTSTQPRSIANSSKIINWDPLILTIKHGLIQMELQQCSHQFDGRFSKTNAEMDTVLIRIVLTQKAFEQCSPYNLPRKVPLKSLQHRGNGGKLKNIDGKSLACMLQNAFRILFQGSIMDDLLPANSSTSMLSRINNGSGKDKESHEITAKMVYKAVDNAHSYLFDGDDRGGSDGGCEKVARGTSSTDMGLDQSNGDIRCDGLSPVSVSASTSIKQLSVADHDNLPNNSLLQGILEPFQKTSDTGENDSALKSLNKISKKASNIPGLVPKLRKYQEAAVEWMLQRERGDYKDKGWEICWIVILDARYGDDGLITNTDPNAKEIDTTSELDNIVMPLYRYQHDCTRNLNAKQSCIYYNPFSGWLTSTYDIARVSTIGNDEAVKGGVLAESMGLGKTIEVLACILSNPKVPFGDAFVTKGNCFEDEERNGLDDPSLIAGHEYHIDKDNLICFCGKGGSDENTLSWVLCSSCNKPMHGMCAGFIGDEDLMKKTTLGPCTHENKLPFRLCIARRCPTCVAAKHALTKDLIQSQATLIVTPPSILSQWEREIKRHTLVVDTHNESERTRPLRVKVYDGVRKLCSMTHTQAKEGYQRRLLHAHYLADADIVLTTFQVLMSDLSHSDDNPYITPEGSSGRRISRTMKRYRVVPSPLMSINWWRICLDEAQRVETPTAASAQMALKLFSQHRWCVSGTPAGRGKMNDLYGLLLFLDSKPFCEKDWFLSAIKAGYCDVLERIAHLLGDILWRSTKSNNLVRDQMGIPEQIEKKVFLNFSSIERHFYQCQLEETILAADVIIGEKKGNKRRKAKDVDMLSNQLHRLRAACCHPQVGVGGIGNLKRQNKYSGTSVATGVLSMSQILDRLIDDAKLKAEEAQRLYILNTNAIACLYRLKAESGSRSGTLIDNDDEINLLQKSSKAYLDAIDIADNNSSPSPIVGEAVLTGSNGFQTPGVIIRDGAALITWVVQTNDGTLTNPEVWTRFDFNGSIKKITSLAIRPKHFTVEENVNCTDCSTLFPRDCVLQVSNAAIGGLFVDTISFTLEKPGSPPGNQGHYEWQQFHGYRPHKSKSWRIYVKNYHDEVQRKIDSAQVRKSRVFVGLEVQLLEPDVLPDSLQRLHILHNCTLTMTSLQNRIREENVMTDEYRERLSSKTMQETITKMRKEKESLESHYIEAARVLQVTGQGRLEELTIKRNKILAELSNLRYYTSRGEETWWNDLVAWCYLYPDRNIQISLYECIEQSLFELFNDPSQPFKRRSFPVTYTLDGLHIALSMRLQENTFFTSLATNGTDHEVFRCIQSITNLSDTPSESEIFENSHCHKCRSDWNQKGPKCMCCKLEEQLLEHQTKINEGEINSILRSMLDWVKQNVNTKSRGQSDSLHLNGLFKKAEKFFAAQEIIRKELDAAKLKWRTHLDLLSDIDELNQCKQTMRLCYEGEDLFGLETHEQAFIVQPRDINGLLMDHAAKQAMAEGNLKRTKEVLRFLKNQNLERKQSVKSHDDDRKSICCICLCPFGENTQAVLRCGHTYHHNCLERIFAQSVGGNHIITCPMRCAIRTKKEDVLIASDMRKDDGSKTHRAVEGSWGTKVDRLVSDLLGVVDIGEKSIVFSQWEDMLHILEIALQTNSISYVRPKSTSKFGDSMSYFRTAKCHVLLLNVKHGAEGLTLVEANHVFMIEPLLNHSMDSQAINRIHRIGQMSKTFIHRYIIEDTIEVKIDRLRAERQSHDGEDEQIAGRGKTEILRAGGLDGGFNENELQELLK